jgi:hypothetical protein
MVPYTHAYHATGTWRDNYIQGLPPYLSHLFIHRGLAGTLQGSYTGTAVQPATRYSHCPAPDQHSAY